MKKKNLVKYAGIVSMLVVMVVLLNCAEKPDPLPIRFIESTFETGTEDWMGDFAFAKTGSENTVKFGLKQEALPSVLQSTLHGLKLEGENNGDSLFLFIKKKVSNLDPAKTYKVAYQLDMCSSFPDTIGSAGRIIYLKAGASTEEPTRIPGTSVSSVSINNGSLAKSGKEMLLLGNVGNGLDSTYYRTITRNNANLAVQVKPSASGEIWLCIGINTRYKGSLSLYFDRIYAAVGEKP